MQYNFDQIVDRSGTYACKLEALPEGAPADAMPLWVADMDFPCAEPIIKALHERIDRKIFGYTMYESEDASNAITGWYKKQFDWDVAKEDIFFSPGVVPALAVLLRFLTQEGDGVIIQRPVYHPFTNKIIGNGRKIVNSPLLYHEGKYTIDFENLEKCFADPTAKGMILCSPHNPVGRVWTPEELRKVVDIAKKYGKWIISDEIHSDLVRKGVVHTPLLKLAPDYADNIVVCTAPSKTFNLAGMVLSNIVIPNKEWQKEWNHIVCDQLSICDANPFGITAMIAAYTQCDDWLEQVKDYIDGNIQYIKDFVAENLPKAHVADAQGTYLVWLDLNAYEKDPKKLEDLMHNVARVAFDEGYIFGEEGNGFERINVATPRANVEECMRRVKAALDTL
ncbi:MalY/PatB family protein [Angelakisella massiliensis]|uniref:MalY/PatB family protein n=1 Tax=Angelakisella massiliensis TaxID=1871018 RepID=UPI0008F94C87|nr:MalY/PatB family protein [Angelakisella massiliensis]